VITLDDLKAICRHSTTGRLAVFVEPLNAAMQEFAISENPARETHFLAQIAHESGGFRYVREIASGAAYEGRADLGNTEAGDGERFRGRGLIQITGRSNYAACGVAARSAAWFWDSRHLNELADRGDARGITKRINGGLNGYQDRLAYLALAQERLA
jgi:putative chitinase